MIHEILGRLASARSFVFAALALASFAASAFETPYLTFRSADTFSLKTNNSAKNWDGTIEYSTDTENWETWNGSEIAAGNAGSDYRLYLRGTGNKTITAGSSNKKWIFPSGSDIYCEGDIEVLRGYDGNPPTMNTDCYYCLFDGNAKLKSAPKLSATTLTARCYQKMFYGCTALETAPTISAMTLAESCCNEMFKGCTSLRTPPPTLPATTLQRYCYQSMFSGCTALETAPSIAATTMASTSCCMYMFKDCTSLVTAPELHTKTLQSSCYQSMFEGCTSLVTIPELTAETLASSCYTAMFKGCTALETAPAISATTLASSCCESMFQNCTKLKTIPDFYDITLQTSCYRSMFSGCSALEIPPALPATTLANYCYNNMFNSCTSLKTLPKLEATTVSSYAYQGMFLSCTALKVSSELTPGKKTWKLPAGISGGTDWNKSMLASTGGTFKDNPVPGTTYYIVSMDSTELSLSQNEFNAWTGDTVSINLASTIVGGSMTYTFPGPYSDSPYSLPGGLTLTSGGALTGKIATAGTYDFVVKVQDTTSPTPLTLDAEYRIIVTDPDPLTAPGVNLGKARVGKEKNFMLSDTVAGGVAPYTFTLASVEGNALPAGYAIADGVLAGTATEEKTNTFRLTVTDKLGVTETFEYMLVSYIPVGLKDDDPDEPETGDTIEYDNGDGVFPRICTKIIASSAVVTWEDSWYYVTGNVTLSKGAIVRGKVSLILCDGATLTIPTAESYKAGIQVVDDGENIDTFTVYAQTGGSGKLNVTGGYNGAGIGGGNGQSAGNVIIYGGEITTTGGSDATGIGGGWHGSGGTVKIYGGNVSAKGNRYSAAIGGAGSDNPGSGGDVYVYGGSVVASAGHAYAAGIGAETMLSTTPQGTLTVGPYVVVKAGSSKNPTTVLEHGVGGVIDLGTGTGHQYFQLETTGPAPLEQVAEANTLAVHTTDEVNWDLATTITGGTTPYSFEIKSWPGKPEGISLSSEGVLTGTFTAAGEHTFTVTVTDSGKGDDAKTDDFTYTITVTVKPRSITYMHGEETLNGLEPSEYMPGTATNLPVTATAPNGYEFGGWYDNAGLTGDAVTSISAEETEDLIFYAKFTPIVYSITYMDGDAPMEGLAPATYTIVSGATLPATATKDGNDFCGWYANLGLTEGPVTTIASGTIDNKIFWAKWEAIVPIERTGDAALQVKAYKSINWNVASGVTGGKAPLTFAASGLPTGVAMSESGVVSGSLAAAGTYPFTVTVTDAKSRQETFDYSITVVEVSPIEEGEPAEPDTGVVIQYKAADGQMRTRMATPVTSSNAAVTWEDSWYYVTGDVTLSAGVTVSGSVCLILGDGATLTTTGAYDCAGVNVANGNTLTIYGQVEGDGALTATGGGNAAGIGGNTSEGWGTIHVYACNITANSSGSGRGIGKSNWGSDAGSLYIHSIDLHVTAGAYEDPTATRSPDPVDHKVSFNNGDKYVLIVYDPTTPLVAGETDLGSVTKGEYVTKNLKNSISGGSPEYTFAVKAGSSLPTELSLLESGLLWGTPTVAGSYSFWVTVRDASSQTIDVEFTLKVNGIFNISYYEADGETPISAQPVTYIEGTGVAHEDMPVPEMTGYDFAGWYTDTDLTEGPVTSISTSEAIDKVFYAKWTATVYPITYYWGTQECAEGDTHNDLLPTSYTIEAEAITLPIPVKNGWYFEGWYDNPQLAGSPVTTIPEGSTGDKAVYSKWEQAGQPFTQKENRLSADAGFEMSISLTPTISGGKKPYSFALKSGSELPGDVTLSEAGVLSGTVAAAGAYEFTVIVTDDVETEPFEATYTLYVDLTKTTTDPNGRDAVFYIGYSGSVILASAISGGTAPYTFALDEDSGSPLPPGMKLNGNKLEGTPTFVGNSYFTLKVTDAKGVTSHLDYWVYSQRSSAQESDTVNGIDWSFVSASPPKEGSRLSIWNSESLTSDGQHAISINVAGCVYVPDGSRLWTGNVPVTCIGRNAFKGCDKITRMTLPDTITDIGENAFDGCTALKAVVIPSSGILEHINTNAFTGATSLEHIYVGKGDKVAFTALLEASGYAVTDENFVVECDFYTLTLDTNFGDELEMPVLTKAYTETLYLPTVGNLPVPTRKDYTFEGWYTEESGGTRINEDDTRSGGDWTLYAHWSTTLPDPVFTVNYKGELTDVTLNGHTEIVIPDTVTAIGDRALDGLRVSANKNLLRVTIPDTVKDIGSRAFAECTKLREINIPEGVTNISLSAFRLCSNLESVQIPGSVETIGDYAFVNCSNLVSVTIGDGVRNIGQGAFGYCTSLSCDDEQGFYIPDSVQTIGSGAFHSVAFTKASLPGSLYSVGSSVSSAFSNVSLLKSIDVMYRTDQTTFVIHEGRLTRVYLNGNTEVVVPNDVTNISTGAFRDLSEMTSVTIPSTVTGIQGGAFENCTGLTEINLPDSLKYLGRAFTGCTNLKNIVIPDSVTELDEGCFGLCDFLESVTIGSGVTEIPHSAFYHCSNLEAVTVRGNVTSIARAAFSGCTALQAIELPDTLKEIGNMAFYNCASLSSLRIPKGVEIGSFAFAHCSSLTSVNISGTVAPKLLKFAKAGRRLLTAGPDPEATSVGQHAFYGCSGLDSVLIGSKVNEIGGGAFGGCSKLKSITVEAGNENYTTVDGMLLTADHTTLISGAGSDRGVVVPANVTTIEEGAFAGFGNITSVTLPDTVQTVGTAAFSNCTALATMTIPSSVTSIGNKAFYGTAVKTVCVSTGDATRMSGLVAGTGYDTTGVTFFDPTATLPTVEKPFEEASNGLPNWQNYVLNQDADEPVKVEGVTDATATRVSIASTLKTPATDTGFTVKYSIDKVSADGAVVSEGERQATSAFSIDLESITTNAFFTMKATIVNDETGAEIPVETENTIGVLAITDAPKTTIIGVPFKSLSEDGSISVANLVHTANLTDGAKLSAYDSSGNLHAWTLESGEWTPDLVVGQQEQTGDAGTIKLDRGKGVWLTRADADLDKPIYLIGEASNESVETELEAPAEENGTAWTLVASPSVEPADVADIVGANTGDRIILPSDGFPRNYSYKNGEWGYDGNDEPEEIAPGITVVRPKRITGDNKIPAGRGFWYLNKDAGSKSINW